MCSCGVCGDAHSYLSKRGLAVNDSSGLAFFNRVEEERRERFGWRVGELRFGISRDLGMVAGIGSVVWDDFRLRLADGESSMTLSLSSSALNGDAPIEDNLQLDPLNLCRLSKDA